MFHTPHSTKHMGPSSHKQLPQMSQPKRNLNEVDTGKPHLPAPKCLCPSLAIPVPFPPVSQSLSCKVSSESSELLFWGQWVHKTHGDIAHVICVLHILCLCESHSVVSEQWIYPWKCHNPKKRLAGKEADNRIACARGVYEEGWEAAWQVSLTVPLGGLCVKAVCHHIEAQPGHDNDLQWSSL